MVVECLASGKQAVGAVGRQFTVSTDLQCNNTRSEQTLIVRTIIPVAKDKLGWCQYWKGVISNIGERIFFKIGYCDMAGK
jgi:hypothetical protein